MTISPSPTKTSTNQTRVVAFVPIKLNSQRLKNKNLLSLGKNPLCWYIFDTLLHVGLIDDIFCFCSDTRIIQHIPKNINFLQRSPNLDLNETKGEEIYDSFINLVDADYYILAHTTSPFLKPQTISQAIHKVLSKENDYDSAFSAQKIQTFAWYNNQPLNYDLQNIPRTQDIKPIFVETSGFYIFSRDLWINHHRRIGFHPYIAEVDFQEGVDIDTQDDYEVAKLFVEVK